MDDLYRASSYPADVQKEIARLGATDIANRWMMGWPGRVKNLLATGRFLPELQRQSETEAKYLSAEDAPRHLARHEILELNGIPAEPPG